MPDKDTSPRQDREGPEGPEVEQSLRQPNGSTRPTAPIPLLNPHGVAPQVLCNLAPRGAPRGTYKYETPEATQQAEPGPAQAKTISFTVFTSPERLSKRFEAGPDESVAKLSGVLFFAGTAHRVDLDADEPLQALGETLQRLSSKQAIGLGVALNGLTDNAVVTVRAKKNDGAAGIARSLEDFHYPKQPGFLLIDGDGITNLRERLIRLWSGFADIGMLTRPSASAGIRHGDKTLEGGEHLFVIVDDVTRSKEVLDALMRLAWCRGEGRLEVSGSGHLLTRSLVDVTVGSPERLVFEGKVEVVHPIVATDPRTPVIHPGAVLQAAGFLAWAEREAPVARFEELRREAARAPHIVAQQFNFRTAWIARRIANGMSPADAEKAHAAFKPGDLNAWQRETLTANDVVEAADGRKIRLGDVLAAPEEYDHVTIADPAEGPGYGRTTAMIMGRTQNGRPFINSFAHGGIRYDIEPGASDADGSASEPLPILDLAALDGVEPPALKWLVIDVLRLGEVGLLTGHGGSGKGRLLLQLAAATVLRRGWLNFMVDHHGPVLIVACEDDLDELHRRLAAIARFYGVSFKDLAQAGLVPMSFAGQDAVLAEPDKAGILRPTPLLKRISDAVRDLRPRLIGFDNAADVYGGDENVRRMVRQFITLLRGLALENDAHVLMTLHPSLTGISSGTGMSGNTAWFNSARAQLYLKAAPAEDDTITDPDMRVLQILKNQNARLTPETLLRWRDGLFLPEGDLTGYYKAAADNQAEDVFLKLLIRLAAQGRDVSHSTGKVYAPKVFAAEPEANGTTAKTLATAMVRLFEANRIHVETEGPASRRRVRLRPGPAPAV